MSTDNSNNPLIGQDPITQYNKFRENVREMNKNLKEIIKNIKPLVSAGLTNGCKISKIISKNICDATENLDSVVGDLDLDNIQDVMNKARANIKDRTGVSVPAGVPNNLLELSDSKSNDAELNGGAYNNIINPLNGQIISIHSNVGKHILKNYIKNFNN